MDVRRLAAGLVVAASCLLLMAGTASAHGTASAQVSEGTTCAVHSLPSFVAQGEFENQASVADVIEVECNPFVYGTGSKVTITASQLYSRCSGDILWYGTAPGEVISARSLEVSLDADGNATVALIAGPNCQAGESLISLHMDEGEYNSYTTSFTVLPPNDTALGVTALPSHQVESSETSSAITIIEAEFPGQAEKYVRVGSEELYRRCGYEPKLVWVNPEDLEIEDGVRRVRPAYAEIGPEYRGLKLDNNGNGFVLAIGDASCSPGSSLIEADLEEKPFTTVTTNFLIESPKPTEY